MPGKEWNRTVGCTHLAVEILVTVVTDIIWSLSEVVGAGSK
jgi:hypothetical protein